MPPDTAAALIERAKRHWPAGRNLEITLEANPNSAEAARFAGFAQAGVKPPVSRRPGARRRQRSNSSAARHDRREALAAIKLSRQLFPRTSFDLIYARPGQSLAAWAAELDEALALAGEHLSLYQLTIEPGTAFHTRAAQGEIILPDEETAAAMFEMTQERLAAAGMPSLRNPQPRAARREAGTTSPLAVWGLSQHRPRRAWPANARRRQIRDPPAPPAGSLA